MRPICLTAAFLAAIVASGPAAGQIQREGCVTHESAVEVLAKKYGERRINATVDEAGRLVEFWANAVTGTWTVTVTTTTRVTCMVAAGQGWTPSEDPET